MIKHQAIQLGIAKLGGVCNCWRHNSFLASAENWSKDCLQLDKHWHMTKDIEPELGVNQVCCREQVSLIRSKVASISCVKRTTDTLKSLLNVYPRNHQQAQSSSRDCRHF